MQINGKIHCLFEQSGTFKNAFMRLGYQSYDYDIQNTFECTDFVMDLFHEIEFAYDNMPSVFDSFTPDDLIFSFFPCIYFCDNNVLFFTGKHKNYKNLSQTEILKQLLTRSENRQYFYTLLLKLFYICASRNLRMILENPYSSSHFLVNNFPYKPAVVDFNRRLRGDYFVKPTQYFFLNCVPTQGLSLVTSPISKTVQSCSPASHSGLCSTARSMISSVYAENFINDFVFGRSSDITQLKLNLL